MATMKKEQVSSSGWRRVSARHGWWVGTTIVYAAIMAPTVAWGLGDTGAYVASITRALRGENLDLWEFGHLFWRPLGYVIYLASSPVFERLAGLVSTAGVVAVVFALNWIGGLVGALALDRFVRRLGVTPSCVPVITLAYMVTFGVLNYAHSGSSYIPGLSCLLVALALLVSRDSIAVGTALSAGFFLACSVGFWAVYVLVIPSALAFPLVWFGFDRRRLRIAALVTASFVLVLGSAYLLAIERQGIRDLAGLRSWVTASSHDIVNIRGFSRAAFGIARSFIFMGKDGILLKRYLLKDPFNPVTIADLVRLSLAKLAFFYMVLLFTIAGLLRDKSGRRLIVLLLLGGIPLLAFAVSWQGGDVERYMPVYPLVFAAWALVLGGERRLRLIQALVSFLVIVMAVVNLPALSRASAARDRALLERRITDLLPRLGTNDRIFVVMIQDPLFKATSGPFSPISRDLNIGALVPVGYASAPYWRPHFARSVQGTWANGGTVWLTKRVLSQRPRSEWDWTEGDEKSVSWSDLPSFFHAFECGHHAGGEDGFAALMQSPHNQQLIQQTLDSAKKGRSISGEDRAARALEPRDDAGAEHQAGSPALK